MKMPKRYHLSAPIFPKLLGQSERDGLLEDLYPVQAGIFDAVDRAAFAKYVITPPTLLTKVYRCLNEKKETVGYVSFQVYQLGIPKDRRFVFRSEMGLLPAYRGGANFTGLLYRESLKFMFRHFSVWRGFPEAYFMATPINPVAYHMVLRDIAEVYPRPGRGEEPGRIRQAMNELASLLGGNQEPGAHPNVKAVGWQLRLSEEDLRRIYRSSESNIRYFLKHNPEFQKGYGLLWLAPATPRNGIRTFFRLIKKRFRSPRHLKKKRVPSRQAGAI